MDLRTNESPMDFQWQQGYGPAGTDSPFLKAAMNNKHDGNAGFAGQKRGCDNFDSPQKPSLPPLFSSTPAPKEPLQWRKTSFTTPQRPIDADFSSGPDQSSPANADTEDTPDPPARTYQNASHGPMVKFQGAGSEQMSSQSLLDKFNSPIRKPHTDMARRIHKRRRRDVDKDVRLARRGFEDDLLQDEDYPPRNMRTESNAPPSKGIILSFFSFIDDHPNLPNTLSYWAQLGLNSFFIVFLMFIFYSFWATIRSDVDEKSREAAADILVEMAMCTKEFRDNKCDSASRVPAMELVCNNWEKCMQRDPSKVGRARISAKTFAQIFDSFVEPISPKAMIFSFAVIVVCFSISNLTFGKFRDKAAHSHPPMPSHAAHVPPQQMEHFGGAEHYFPPYSGHIGMPDTDQGASRIAMGSPVRRIGYR